MLQVLYSFVSITCFIGFTCYQLFVFEMLMDMDRMVLESQDNMKELSFNTSGT